jgi:hypothetical protein
MGMGEGAVLEITVDSFTQDGITYRFLVPHTFGLRLSGPGSMFVVEDGDLDLYLVAATPVELLHELHEHIVFLWHKIVEEDTHKLSDGALELRDRIKSLLVVETADADSNRCDREVAGE